MSTCPQIFTEFIDWSKTLNSDFFSKIDAGIADQDIENIAWLNIDTKRALSNITLWDTGDYLITIDSITQENPVFTRRGTLGDPYNFQTVFHEFFETIASLEGSEPS